MLLLIVLALLAIILFGVGFTIHWLFILAIIASSLTSKVLTTRYLGMRAILWG